jgi:hypothetical protein
LTRAGRQVCSLPFRCNKLILGGFIAWQNQASTVGKIIHIFATSAYVSAVSAVSDDARKIHLSPESGGLKKNC